MVALVCTARAGTKLLQSFLDGHERILMIPGYPLMYLYPHWSTWQRQFGSDLSWPCVIDLFCEKHGSVLDSRRGGLSGLDRLGPSRDQHIEIDEERFRETLGVMLEGVEVRRRTFVLAVHYAYGICKQWDVSSRSTLLYHVHDAHVLGDIAVDFPALGILSMIRHPTSSLHSTQRGLGIVDLAKLNRTDSTIYARRTFRLACHLQFEGLDCLLAPLDKGRVAAAKHESLHENLDEALTGVLRWMGVESSECLRTSTFDGKLWWGDIANAVPVNGPDPHAMSDKWKMSFNPIDTFVIEGVALHFLDRYGYGRSRYRRDTPLNRCLLLFAILLPTRSEWRMIVFYLDPRTHVAFLRAAAEESVTGAARKDYTRNATYLYKWAYVDLQLWRARWHQRLLTWSERHRDGDEPIVAPIMTAASRVAYVAGQYGRLWLAIVSVPVEIARRCRIYYGSLWRRVRGRSFLPPVVNGTSFRR